MALIEAGAAGGAARPAGTGNGALRDWLRALEATATIAAQPQRLLFDIVETMAEQHGDAAALLSARERFSYRELMARAHRYARWAMAEGLGKGATVCLMMPNRPEYVAAWLGLTSVGVVVALINTQLRGQSLAHCIDVAEATHVIVAADYAAEMHSAVAHLLTRPKILMHGDGAEIDDNARIDRTLDRLPAEPFAANERPTVSIGDRALLIYTSGTTGLPKAANVSHRRLLQWSLWFAGLMNIGPSDRMYDCLPLYHSVGGVAAIGALLVRGGSVLIRARFSASEFWDDVVEGECTLFQYIGELCRYLVNAPRHPRERAHRLRLACGNGLRADVWEKFQERFAVPRILEFYAATEGNVSLYNVEGRVGAIGRVPPFLAARFPLALVRFDPASGQPARGADGLCIRCAADEAGEAIGRIPARASEAGEDFEGYTDRHDTEQKILRDVFAPGDRWYRTGDLMRADGRGFFYFVDRIGDTFRWKGENVATSEVAAAIMAFPGVREVAVYGVAVPGTEGAAGMAALVTDGELDLTALRLHLTRRLPPYARPKFLRIADRIETTTTFKQLTGELRRDGFDPARSRDPLYVDDAQAHAFVPLDAALFTRITTGDFRL